MASAQSKRWCFTLNNYSDEEFDNVCKIQCKYLIVGKEVGDMLTPHLQGYVVFAKNMRLRACKLLIPRAHFEVAKGTTDDNVVYCSKGGQVTEVGERPVERSAAGQREKRRWQDAWQAAKEGRLEDVPEDIRIKYYGALRNIHKDYMQRPGDSDDVTGVWIYGPPGVGKSRKAREDYPNAYLKMQNKWWDGYQGEEFVILDDFDSKELGHHLKIWSDRYSFLAEIKGGALHIRPKKFVVTSNYHPSHFGWDDEMTQAIIRRFTLVELR